jgi:KaiC/GvpD/RAD55 family RecA-like ATPase
MENKNNKQRLLVEYLISSPDTFALCKGIVQSEYFDPDLRKSVEFIHTYYDKYSAVPTPQMVLAETDVSLTTHQITRDQVSYCTDEIEKFCRRRAVQQAILAAPKMIAEGKYGEVEQMIKDAVSITLHREIGLTYFENPNQRLQAQMETPARTPTQWAVIDELLGGGLARREIFLVSANSGGGKSITLANLALNFLNTPKNPSTKQKMDVLYISLELSEELIAQRFDTMLTGISSVVWQQHHTEIGETVAEIGGHMGRLTIKRMESGTNANAIRAYLKQFELRNGYVPDMLIIDYLDKMGANQVVSMDNVFQKDKLASEQLSDILYDYNMFGATASQQNRSAIDAQELNQGHVAGGLSKVMEADWYLSIIMTPAMKAAGEIGFAFLKTRSSDGVGKTVYLKWDNKTLRIKNLPRDEEIDDDGVITSRLAKLKEQGNTKRKTLLDSFQVDNP